MAVQASRRFEVWALCAVALAFAGSTLSAQHESARKRGRAVVEFRDKAIHAVAAYNYSQRNHDQRWIVFQAALTTTSETVIHRDEIALRTPQGREIPLATQTRIGEDVKHV